MSTYTKEQTDKMMASLIRKTTQDALNKLDNFYRKEFLLFTFMKNTKSELSNAFSSCAILYCRAAMEDFLEGVDEETFADPTDELFQVVGTVEGILNFDLPPNEQLGLMLLTFSITGDYQVKYAYNTNKKDCFEILQTFVEDISK